MNNIKLWIFTLANRFSNAGGTRIRNKKKDTLFWHRSITERSTLRKLGVDHIKMDSKKIIVF